MKQNIIVAIFLVFLLSFFFTKNIHREHFLEGIEITDADDYKDDLGPNDNEVESEKEPLNKSMLAMQDFTTFAIKGDKGEPGEKGDKGPIGMTGTQGKVGPQGESLSGSIRSTGKLWLGSEGNGNSGSDNNYETQLYLGGAPNQGANNGRIGHTTYKLKIDGYDNNGSDVYPIYVQDKNKNVDFYIKNRINPSSKPLVGVNGDIKLLSSDSIIESPNMKAKIIELNGKNVEHHLMPKGTIVAYNGQSNIPHGWAICNGSNGTPDLRGRFILGSSNTKKFGSKGGAERVRLHINEMPSHFHHGLTESSGGHYHRIGTLNRQGNPDGWGDGGRHYWRNSNYHKNRTPDQGKNTDYNGSHTHRVRIGNTGGNQSHENMPPYYVLVYIMKII